MLRDISPIVDRVCDAKELLNSEENWGTVLVILKSISALLARINNHSHDELVKKLDPSLVFLIVIGCSSIMSWPLKSEFPEDSDECSGLQRLDNSIVKSLEPALLRKLEKISNVKQFDAMIACLKSALAKQILDKQFFQIWLEKLEKYQKACYEKAWKRRKT